jgi:hypothetical protein
MTRRLYDVAKIASSCEAARAPSNEPALLYRHGKRPAWGYGAIEEVLEDRTTFKFDDGSSRSGSATATST